MLCGNNPVIYNMCMWFISFKAGGYIKHINNYLNDKFGELKLVGEDR